MFSIRKTASARARAGENFDRSFRRRSAMYAAAPRRRAAAAPSVPPTMAPIWEEVSEPEDAPAMAAVAALDDAAEAGEVLENVAEHSQNVMLTFTYDGGMGKVLHVQNWKQLTSGALQGSTLPQPGSVVFAFVHPESSSPER